MLMTPRLGSQMDVSEPMKESEPTNQEVIATQLIEDIHQLEKISLGEGAAACQACGTTFQEGDPVVVYAFRPAGAHKYQLGHAVCGNDKHDLPTEYTLGVRELLIEGRVGICSDAATQSTWQVLLAPDVVGVSAAATRSLRKPPTGSHNTTVPARQRAMRLLEAVAASEPHRAETDDAEPHTDRYGGDDR